MADPTQLAPEQHRTLARLIRLPELRRFHLVGGSAVAWHLGHRRSRDPPALREAKVLGVALSTGAALDLFSDDEDVDLERARTALTAALPDAEVVSATDVSLRIRAGGTEIDIVRYAHATLEAPSPGPEGFPVAGLADLAAMKLAAIARRGIRRDFWDLHAILTAPQSGLDLDGALQAYRRRFGVAQPDLYHVIRALTYFDDAERETVWPAGLTRQQWTEIKQFFTTAAPSFLRR